MRASNITRLSAIIVGALLSSVASASPPRFVVFGDSLSDPGNYFAVFGQTSTAPYTPLPDAPYDIGGHHFSNGPTWIEQLADELHSDSAGPALADARRFDNYAVGRARARAGAPAFPDYDLSTQVTLFLDHVHGRASPNPTYVVWIGANDLDDALGALGVDPTGASSAEIVQSALTAVADDIRALWSAGARRFLVPNMPDLAEAPVVRLLGAPAEAAATRLSLMYDGALEQTLSALDPLPGIQIDRLDIYGLLNEVIAAPNAYELTDTVDPCLAFFVVVNPICEHPAQYLLWDGIHPTKAGHRIIADAARQQLRFERTRD